MLKLLGPAPAEIQEVIESRWRRAKCGHIAAPLATDVLAYRKKGNGKGRLSQFPVVTIRRKHRQHCILLPCMVHGRITDMRAFNCLRCCSFYAEVIKKWDEIFVSLREPRHTEVADVKRATVG